MLVKDNKRIPSLDGLRAISIFLVLIDHLGGTTHFFLSERLTDFLGLGNLGVNVFFVISGLLITSLLFNEMEKTNSVSLARFYFRRTFRIFPPYYVFILALGLLRPFDWFHLANGDVLHAITYTSNYHPDRSWAIGHTWSLSVEEQFYLLWPAALVLLGKRRGLIAALSLIILCPIIRLGLWFFVASAATGIGHRFETVADSIAIGCLLAGKSEWPQWIRRWYDMALGSKYVFFAPILVLVADEMHEHPKFMWTVGLMVTNVMIAISIDWCVNNHSGVVGKVLNSKPLVLIGVMSYSIYLWQQIFLDRASTLWVDMFPFNLVMAIIMSLMSFYLIERPSLNLRVRIEKLIFNVPARHNLTLITDSGIGPAYERKAKVNLSDTSPYDRSKPDDRRPTNP